MRRALITISLFTFQAPVLGATFPDLNDSQEYELVGVIHDQQDASHNVALVKVKGTETTVALRPGDRLGQATVDAIEAERVVINTAGAHTEIVRDSFPANTASTSSDAYDSGIVAEMPPPEMEGEVSDDFGGEFPEGMPEDFGETYTDEEGNSWPPHFPVPDSDAYAPEPPDGEWQVEPEQPIYFPPH